MAQPAPALLSCISSPIASGACRFVPTARRIAQHFFSSWMPEPSFDSAICRSVRGREGMALERMSRSGNGTDSRSSEDRKISFVQRCNGCDIEPPRNVLHRSKSELVCSQEIGVPAMPRQRKRNPRRTQTWGEPFHDSISRAIGGHRLDVGCDGATSCRMR